VAAGCVGYRTTEAALGRYDGAATRLPLPRGYIIMGKAIGAACIALVALAMVDHHFNSGQLTDVAFAILRQLRHSFG
jgi:hypothetical protein